MQPLTANSTTVRPFVDILAWRAAESNTAWATTISFPAGTTQVTTGINDYNTRPGIKAGISILPDENYWDTKLYWTYYSTDTTNSIPLGAKIISSLFFSGSFFLAGDVFFGASSHWQLAMNMLDLEVARHFQPISPLTLSPKIGLKGGSINQDISANWNAVLYQSTENVTSDFTGIGPTLGLNAKWNIFQQVDLIGDITTALMYGRWNMKDTYKRPAAFLITPTTITTSLNQAQFGSLMTDYYLGLQWTHQGISRVTVQLGYEMQYWSNQLRLIAVQQLPAQGDLTIQGATCGISIDL